MKSLHYLFGILFFGTALAGAQAQSFQFLKIDPKGTYLRDSQASQAPTALNLLDAMAALQPSIPNGPAPEFVLDIRTVGWFNRAIDNPASKNISNQAVAVFAGSSAVDQDWSKQFRVFAPVDKGPDFFTLPTWVGNLPTDIEEDFGIDSETFRIEIPTGASHLLLTTYDNGFWNNGDDFSLPGADPRGFGVEWRVLAVQSVPEPASLSMMLLGLAALARRKRHR